MTTSTIKRTLLALTIIAIPLSCIREAESQPQEEAQEKLHEVVFHAGWEPETKTALQEDGSVWWSPGDEISLFVRDENGTIRPQSGGYKLTATITEPAAKADFVGQIAGNLEGATYTAIYPYNESNRVDMNGQLFFSIPAEQVAKEATFENGLFVSAAVSDGENLMFRNLCGGIKFSVAHEGIKKVEFYTTGAALAGKLMLDYDGYIRVDYYSYPMVESRAITVLAPNDVFEVGKYYYAVVAASEYGNDIEGVSMRVSYYTDDSVASVYLPGCLFKRSVFKRLYEADKGLKFKRFYDSMARLDYDFLPEGIDKTAITEAHFHVLDPTVTDTIISSGEGEYEPIYFEMIGTVAHFYTNAQVYKCNRVNFEGWKSLCSLDLSMFDVSEAQLMNQAFMDCHSLETLDLSSFDTGNVRDFNNMFNNCVSLRSLDVTNFDTSNAREMYAMFGNCKSLTTLDVSGFNTSSVTTFQRMFAACSGLTELDVTGLNTSSATNLAEMFSGCSLLQSIDVSSFDTSNATRVDFMFSGCRNLKQINVSNFDTRNMEAISGMFSHCCSLERADLSSFDLTNMKYMDWLFYICSNLREVMWPSSSTSNVVTLSYMFDQCSSLEQIDLSSFDTHNVTMMLNMFTGCSKLRSLDLSSFDTRKVTCMSHMFSGCRNLERLDISSFDSSSLTEAYNLFYNTYKLSSLNLGSFDLGSAAIDGAGQWLGDLTQCCHIRCTNDTKEALISTASRLRQDKYIWHTDGSSLPDIQFEPANGLYCSTDYSKDKTVRIVQLASEGAGIDLVVMGDAYSDRLIDDGTYDADMEKAIDAIFAVEPFKSFKHLFNIYIVYAVSENEVIGKSTALACFNNGILGSEDWAWQSYYHCATKKAKSGECSPVIIMNSPISNGTATGFLESTTGDYMNDPNRDDYHGGFSDAVAYISGPNDERFDYTVRHEFGHSFGILMDEYIKYSYAITDYDITSWQLCFAYGMWKNVDLVSDDTVKWAKFINDSRYAGTGIGIYEGALYETGAWRPSPESIMNSSDSGFNAPSREAIFYRIHKLAYGKDWNYSYEDFVTYDSDNIAADKARMSASKAGMKRATPSFKREPIFKRSIVTGPDGKERIKIEMN